MKTNTTYFLLSTMLLGIGLSANSQVCDPSVAPTGLISTYTPGSGALLEWDVVPGSVGMQVKAISSSGEIFARRIIAFESDQFLVPEPKLSSGTYNWYVQASCSFIPPYNVTPVSASSSFMVGSCPDPVMDIDGNVYATEQIGSQCWTSENLKVERYRNGDNIPTGLSDSAWSSTTNGAFAVFDNVAANKATYGLLYNWRTTADPRGLCPTGWHVPTDTEWTQLTDYLGGESVAGGKMKTTGTLSAGTGLWLSPNWAATNISGFSGLPSGYRDLFGNFLGLGLSSYWWSSTEDASISVFALFRLLRYDNGNVLRGSNFKEDGNSVRCLQDE